MPANRTVPNTGTVSGLSFATDIKEEIEGLYATSNNPLTLTGASTANAIVGVCSIPILAYTVGLRISWTVGATNTNATTINAGAGVVDLRDNAGGTLGAGALVAGDRAEAEFNGAHFRVLSGLRKTAGSVVQLAGFSFAQTSSTSLATTLNARTKYPLNRSRFNDIVGCSFNTSTGVVTLPVGFYEWESQVQSWNNDGGLNLHLRNTTTGLDVTRIAVQTAYIAGAAGQFTVTTGGSTFELQYFATSAGYLAWSHVVEAGIEREYGYLKLRRYV